MKNSFYDFTDLNWVQFNHVLLLCILKYFKILD